MIVDCFTFFNEFDLLEVRVNTLAPYVDAFVLCEANRTFQGAEKPYYFERPGVVRFSERFSKKMLDMKKPLYIVHADLSYLDGADNAWAREHAQRRKLIDQLGTLSPRDRIILSDIDEIPFMGKWSEGVVDAFYGGETVVWGQDLFYYWVNMRCWRWLGPVSCTWETLQEQFHCDLQLLRDLRSRAVLNDDGGWHFSFLGGPEAIKTKIEAFSHTEYRHCADLMSIECALRDDWKQNRDVFGRDNIGMKFELMPDDSHLPAYLVKNKERFKDWWYRP